MTIIAFFVGILVGIFVGWYAASWSIFEDFKAAYKKKTGKDL